MKHVVIILSLFFIHCSSSKSLEKEMNSYIGKSKAEIMLVFGINPVKDGWVDGLGRVLAYTSVRNAGFGVNSQQYYKHTVFILNQDMKCIGWSVRNEPLPFDRLDVRIFRSAF